MAKKTKARKVSLGAKLIPRGSVTKNPKQPYKCGGKIKKAK